MKKVFLVIAVVLSSFSFAQEKMEKREKMSPDEKVKARVVQLTKELSLNDKQIVRVTELVKTNVAKREEFKNQNKEARKDNRDKMKVEMETTKAEMKKILTEEQFKKFEENNVVRKEKMLDKRNDRQESKTKI